MKTKDSQDLLTNTEANIRRIKVALQDTEDLYYHQIFFNEHLPEPDRFSVTLILLATIAEPDAVYGKLADLKVRMVEHDRTITDLQLIEKVMEIGKTTKAYCLEEVIDRLLEGDTVLLFPEAAAITVKTLTVNSRPNTEPDNEVTIKGPHDGFNEVLRNNINLVRNHLKSPLIKVESCF